MRLPKTLKYLGIHIFQNCFNHPKIYIDDGFPYDLHANPLDGASGGPPPGTLAGGVLVWDLRTLRHVVIPEGTERIGNHWFYKCGIGSVVIPASVKSIELEAFSMCTGLNTVEFAPDSRLEKIRKRSFWATNLERITIPRSVTTIEQCAFGACMRLRDISFQSESRLQSVGRYCFPRSEEEPIALPNGVVRPEEQFPPRYVPLTVMSLLPAHRPEKE